MTSKVVIKLKKQIPEVPYFTPTSEAFDGIREYYISLNKPIPQSDIKWYIDELAQEKKEFDEFWKTCSVTKAVLDAAARGGTELEIMMAEMEAKKHEVKRPDSMDMDPGPMPEYGTKDFWTWCNKRKQIRLQKEKAIIEAGGVVPPQKVKKPLSKKKNDKKPLPQV